MLFPFSVPNATLCRSHLGREVWAPEPRPVPGGGTGAPPGSGQRCRRRWEVTSKGCDLAVFLPLQMVRPYLLLVFPQITLRCAFLQEARDPALLPRAPRTRRGPAAAGRPAGLGGTAGGGSSAAGTDLRSRRLAPLRRTAQETFPRKRGFSGRTWAAPASGTRGLPGRRRTRKCLGNINPQELRFGADGRPRQDEPKGRRAEGR